MFDRDKITESFSKESLGSPMKIVVLVSSAHIPMRARGIVRSILGDQEILELNHIDIHPPHVIITDIIVRELGFLTLLKNRKIQNNTQTIHTAASALRGLQLRFEAEAARAKLTYVREFYTLGAMNRIRKSKPDLIIDISDGAQVHEIILEHSMHGVLTVSHDQTNSTVKSIQRSISGNNTLLERPYTPQTIKQTERTVLLESILLLDAGKQAIN